MASRSSHGAGPTRRDLLRSASSVAAVGAVTALAGCQDSGESYETGDLEVRGSVEQVAVFDRGEEVTLMLLDEDDAEIDTGTTDHSGSYLFRGIDPGTYVVRDEAAMVESETFEVLAPDDHPETEFYADQTLEAGYGYFETRDGTMLGYQVKLPDESEWGGGPYPTVIDYSGYQPSNSFWDGVDDRFLPRGYAVVGVNMRGTGCSGGSFDYFEKLQSLDGYDMVEVVAAQDWSDGIALIGKSYPGISQLFVAAERPPSLDAIVPGHVVDDFYRGVVYPGGIQNAGFANDWATSQELRISYPNVLQDWVNERAEGEDEQCRRNQRLRGQNLPLVDRIEDNVTDTAIWNERRPWDFVDQIEVPTLLVNAWQDEQTGGRPANLLTQFDETVPVRFVGTNGDHDEYYGETIFGDIVRFLSYYVRDEIPAADAESFDDFEAALAAYESEAPHRVYWETGSGPDGDRDPRATTDFEGWPPDGSERERLHLHPDGTLASAEPESDGETSTYQNDPRGSVELADWDHPPDANRATFVSEPIEGDMAICGPSVTELWVGCDADDVDVCVMLSEVRPDGSEVYIQPGWQRASHRAEDEERSTDLVPWHRHTDESLEPLEGIERVRVEHFPVAHVLRAGSQLKLTVTAPGGYRELWRFDALTDAGEVEVAHDSERPSALTVPVVNAPDVPPEAPSCGTLRNQPCR